MKTISVPRLVVALALCLVAAAISGLLLLQHHGEGTATAAVEQVCGGEDDGPNGCETVASSPWSSVAGFPLAGLGVAFYSSMVLLLALSLLVPGAGRTGVAGLALLGLALALLVDLVLLGVQALAVNAFCILCILTYVLGAGAFLALLPARSSALVPGAPLADGEGRLALAGWVLASLATIAAVIALEATLDHREGRRQLALLGAPTSPRPEATPAADAEPPAGDDPTPGDQSTAGATEEPTPTTPAEDVSYWKQKAQELQQTLDDPQKREQYFALKVQREFDAAPAESIDLEDVPFKGPAEAPAKVVEYSDFLCPYCRNLAAALSQFVPQAGGRVAVYFKNFPLDRECNEGLSRTVHPGACALARGAICAHRQDKFDAYHDRVFSAEGLRNPTDADVVRLAGEAGLNAAAVRGCLEDPATAEALGRQVAEAQRLEVHSTPTIYVNGRKLPRVQDLVPVVDKEAQKGGFPPLGQ